MERDNGVFVERDNGVFVKRDNGLFVKRDNCAFVERDNIVFVAREELYVQRRFREILTLVTCRLESCQDGSPGPGGTEPGEF